MNMLWRTPEQDHSRRLVVAYQAASIALIAVGTFWVVWMTLQQRWSLVAVNVGEIVAGVFLLYSVRRPTFRMAAAIVHVFLFLVILEICLIYDIPNEAAPRVTQVYFLAMAFLFYLTFRQVSLAATYAVVAIYLGGFVLFSGTSFGLPNATPLPDESAPCRRPAAWRRRGRHHVRLRSHHAV